MTFYDADSARKRLCFHAFMIFTGDPWLAQLKLFTYFFVYCLYMIWYLISFLILFIVQFSKVRSSLRVQFKIHWEFYFVSLIHSRMLVIWRLLAINFFYLDISIEKQSKVSSKLFRYHWINYKFRMKCVWEFLFFGIREK